jgi:nucleotide-binding universal stress UspA family protein
MTFRNLLVPVVGEKSDRTTLETALLVARLFDGHLDALHVRGNSASQMPLLDESVDVQTVQRLLKQFQESIESRGNTAQSQFETFLQANQVELCKEPPAPNSPSASLQLTTGVEAQEVARIGGAYDLIVVDLALARSRNDSRETLEEVLFSTGRPVLLAPSAKPESIGDTILLGWNRTAQSARTVLSAMPFLEQAKRVIVLMVATGAKEGPSPQDVARTLAWHDIETEVKEIAPDGRSVGHVLLDEAKEVEADLLVMGAYSHSRFREKILGGVTKYVIEHAELPVFLAH